MTAYEQMQVFVRVIVAAKARVAHGHNDTCSCELVPSTPCSCGHDELGEAIEALCDLWPGFRS